jgi:hypothetical protein
MTHASAAAFAAVGAALVGATLTALCLGRPASATNATAATAATATAVRPTAVHGPRVREADQVFDWGSIPAQQQFEHVFVLHNDGDQPLHIVRAHPS